jgi:hypothetical protein
MDHPALQKVPLPGALEPYRGYVPHALITLLLLIGILVWRGSGDAAATQQPTLVEAPPYEAAKPGKQTAQKAEPKPTEVKPPEPEAAPEPAPETEKKKAEVEVQAPAGASARLQSDMQEALDHLLNARAQNSRRTAAKWLLKVPNVPRYIALMADLELNGRCADKKEIVDRMRTLGDPRVLPALERLADAPRRGCGFFRMYDCNACLRRELDQTIGALRESK